MNPTGKFGVTPINTDYVTSKEIYERKMQKRRKGLIRRLTVFAIIMAVVVGSMVSVILSQRSQINKKETERAQLEKKLKEEKHSEKAYRSKIRLLHNDDYIGELARKDFLLSKKGEIIFPSHETDKH
ncbi:cell division protein DivIC [Scopulibacillus daqui]|uniref:Cell division protein DivIC n=1 Tax=Scopulibacillus daqui TaxID=1469162 RepID=A0ABS2Q2C8_9BACL|nr:septum formation initiator family protein [Scopulibacillus daqui]MBM7646452.1 cell division protein DivIC [Scopulibacillus daqui]